jgi:hypothetical protein
MEKTLRRPFEIEIEMKINEKYLRGFWMMVLWILIKFSNGILIGIQIIV